MKKCIDKLSKKLREKVGIIIVSTIIYALALGVVAMNKSKAPIVLIFSACGFCLGGAMILVTREIGKKFTYYIKILFFSFFWIMSSIMLIEPQDLRVDRIFYAFIFIFMACMMPDLFTNTEEKQEQENMKMRKELHKASRKINHLKREIRKEKRTRK